MRFPAFLRTLVLAGALLPSAAVAAPADQAFVDRVAGQLLSAAPAAQGMEWPPVFAVTELPASGRINACARLERALEGGRLPRPRVDVSDAMLSEIVQGDADRLAYILGHELGHILLGHVRQQAGERSPFLQAAIGRERELTADHMGVELLAAAGFSASGAFEAIERAITVEGDYSPFEGLLTDHPCWGDRLAALDPGRGRPGSGHSGYRGVASLKLPDGKIVSVGDSAAEVMQQLGEPTSNTVIPGTGVRRLGYGDRDLELVATDRILAIRTRALGVPSLGLKDSAAAAPVLRAGIERADLDQLLGDQYEYVQLLDPDVNYRYYRTLGLAVRVQGGRVTELVIVQVPSRSLLG